MRISGVFWAARAFSYNTMRSLVSLMSECAIVRLLNWSRSFYLLTDEANRIKKSQSDITPQSIFLRISYDGEPLRPCILSRHEPWLDLPRPACHIPGMLTTAEEKYYTWITKYYSGAGAVLEIGTFLGRCTWILAQGLIANPGFGTRKLHAYDAFTWYPSMDKWITGVELPRVPSAGESFEDIFQGYVSGLANHIDSHRIILGGVEINDELKLSWHGGPIEMLFVDCGSTLDVNEGWFSSLESSFIPNTTLIIMQDWQNFKGPYRFWVQIRQFTDRHADTMMLLHEINDGGIACFLYTAPTPERWSGIS